MKNPHQLPGDNEYLPFIENLLDHGPSTRPRIMEYLQGIQQRYHYLPGQAISALSSRTGIPENRIYSIATFYHQFRLSPAGKHTIRVCVGTACHVNGALKVHDAFRSQLNIPAESDTDSQGLFTVTKAACLGCCMLAPAVQIDDEIFGPVDPERAGSLIDDFLRTRKKPRIDTSPGMNAGNSPKKILLCQCSSCMAAGALSIRAKMEETIRMYRLPMEIRSVGCTGLSWKTPYFEIHENGKVLLQMGPVHEDDVESILLSCMDSSRVLHRFYALSNKLIEKILRPGERLLPLSTIPDRQGDSEFQSHKKSIATEHAGILDPLSLEEYENSGGFRSFHKCTGANPEDLITILSDSGLRGRGGAGFPSATKWKTVLQSPSPTRFVICNADEGDPGAFMDRLLIESFPFRVLEGIAIACATLSARQAYVYIRAEYPLAASRMQEAITMAESKGLWGPGHNQVRLRFSIEIVEGAGAFVCGEETALIAAIEGERGIPRTRPPYPAVQGLFGEPTLINNVETFSLIPGILGSKFDHFSGTGTPASRGTKTFALAGKIQRSGLIEVPMGITIREIVEEIGGGMKQGSIFKAVQIGGPAGGCIPAHMADRKIDFDELKSAGVIMGSGGLIILDQNDCMVELARYFMEFAVSESCGRCVYCRVGTRRLLTLLEKLTQGTAPGDALIRLEEMALLVRERSKCGLGKSSVTPFLTSFRHFESEYRAHANGKCPAGSCKALIRHSIDQTLCIGCTRCASHCPVSAIEGKPLHKHRILTETCTQCGTCKSICPQGAIRVD